MRVFLSWSGETSKQVALVLRDWLPSVIQAIEPFMSAEDIEKGARWAQALTTELKDTRAGVLCLTPDSVASPWLNFEAGALSKTIEKTYVCPYLHGLTPADVSGPPALFQASLANRDDTKRMIATLNRALGERLSDALLERAFDTFWPGLEERLAGIRIGPGQPHRSDREILEEMLALVRGLTTVAGRQITTETLTEKLFRMIVEDRRKDSSNPMTRLENAMAALVASRDATKPSAGVDQPPPPFDPAEADRR